MKLTNHWNRFVYRLWAPVYDSLFDRFFAAPGRRRAMQALNLQPGECVILVGVGTGADLPLLPNGIQAVGVDLSPEMLSQAKAKLSLTERDVTLIQGDAQSLPLAAGQVDAALLNLVLSVVPDAAGCFSEVLRSLRPDGRAVIFDKFLPDGSRLTLWRKLFNLITMLFGTDITRRFGDLAAGNRYVKIRDEPSLLRGAYRVILVRSY